MQKYSFSSVGPTQGLAIGIMHIDALHGMQPENGAMIISTCAGQVYLQRPVSEGYKYTANFHIWGITSHYFF